MGPELSPLHISHPAISHLRLNVSSREGQGVGGAERGLWGWRWGTAGAAGAALTRLVSDDLVFNPSRTHRCANLAI